METKRLILTPDDHRKGPFWVAHDFLKTVQKKFNGIFDEYTHLGCPRFDPFTPNTNYHVIFNTIKEYLSMVNESNRKDADELWNFIEKLIIKEFYPGLEKLQLHVLMSAFFDEDKKLMVDIFYKKRNGKKTERSSVDFANFFCGKYYFVAFYKVCKLCNYNTDYF